MCDVLERLDKKSRLAEKKEMAKKMLLRGKYTIEEIAEDTGLSVEEIKELKNQIEK